MKKSDEITKGVFAIGIVCIMLSVLIYANQIRNEIKKNRSRRQASPFEYTMTDLGSRFFLNPMVKTGKLVLPLPDARLQSGIVAAALKGKCQDHGQLANVMR